MHALHLQTTAAVIIVFASAAADLLRFKHYLAAKIFHPDSRLMEHIET